MPSSTVTELPGEAIFLTTIAGGTWKVKFILCNGLAEACYGDLQFEQTEVDEW